MSLRITAAHSSSRGVKKSKLPNLRRSSSSPFASLPRRKPVQRSKAKPEKAEEEDEDFFNDKLDDLGLVKALATDLTLRDVPQAVQYIKERMFSPVPQDSTGMSSTRIAEILNYRSSIPPIATVVHVHALLNAPTSVEREIAELVHARILRKVIVPGRGVGIGEALILAKDLEAMVRGSAILTTNAKESFLDLVLHILPPTASHIPRASLAAEDAKALMQAGFLTTATQGWTATDAFSRPGDGSHGTLTSLHNISRAASGSLAAVGGQGAVHEAGGSGGGFKSGLGSGDFILALPTMGPFLKLLTNARAHMVSLLSKSRSREAPLTWLRERWDGGIAGDDAATTAKKSRGHWTGVLPGRTRKWKQFSGVRFEWVLEECVGSGLVEVFETGSVGRGVRALR